jgi:uncharacterized membrane protein
MSDFLVGLITVLIYIAVVVTWFFGLFDLFARGDLYGWQKGLWLLIVIFVPIIGVFVYFLLRPKEVLWWSETRREETLRQSDPRTWEMGEIETLTRLRSQGTITNEEFATMKQRVLAQVYAPSEGESA